MTQADSVHSTPRRTAPKIKHKKAAKVKKSVTVAAAKLTAAAIGLERADRALTDLYKKFGDDADSRNDYQALEVNRNEHIATLVTVPARSAAGLRAKASALRLPAMVADWDQHQQIAVSLADDIVKGADPIFAALDAYHRVNAEYMGFEGGDIPDELGDRHWDAYKAVLRTRPTTPAGLVALTSFARERSEWLIANSSVRSDEDERAVFAAIDDAAKALFGKVAT